MRGGNATKATKHLEIGEILILRSSIKKNLKNLKNYCVYLH